MFKKFLAVLVMLYATLALAAVDVNKATEAQLDAVKGIGPVTSKMILAERKKGDFKNWEDFIERIKGVGDARAAKLSGEGLTVSGAAYKVAAKDKKAGARADRTRTTAESCSSYTRSESTGGTHRRTSSTWPARSPVGPSGRAKARARSSCRGYTMTR